MALYEVPTGPSQRSMAIAFGSTIYGLRLAYADVPEGGWFFDLSDAQGNPLLCGVPLVTGADLLGQFAYVGVAGGLFVSSDPQGTVPDYGDLGVSARLLFADAASLAAYLDAVLARFTVTPSIYSGAIGVMGIGAGSVGREV